MGYKCGNNCSNKHSWACNYSNNLHKLGYRNISKPMVYMMEKWQLNGRPDRCIIFGDIMEYRTYLGAQARGINGYNYGILTSIS